MTDTQVRVKVVEARQLEGSNVHPVCKLTLFGETKTTRVKKATGNPIWNEVFYYSNNISPAEIVDEMINFEVSSSVCLSPRFLTKNYNLRDFFSTDMQVNFV